VPFAIAALFAHCVARGFLEEAMHRKAASISQAVKEHASYVADSRAARASDMWNVLTATGIALTVLSVISMVTAAMRGERAWYFILLLLLVFDIGLPALL
jgi:hypothetical protein